ncbi:MAG: hypothetical protein LBG88_01060 [Christensenellaceae bacterium]|jgi:hypothetical protein|nr:hypothetical protein [Christensenellaceae bacterium]
MSLERIEIEQKCQNPKCDGKAHMTFSQPASDIDTEWKCGQCNTKNTFHFDAKSFNSQRKKQLRIELMETGL